MGREWRPELEYLYEYEVGILFDALNYYPSTLIYKYNPFVS